MPNLLLSPLGDSVWIGWAEGSEILETASSDIKDKPVALQSAYEALAKYTPDEIVMENGPGNFTSLRVALGFVRGLALGYGIASRGIGSFAIDYHLMEARPPRTILYRDARGGRIYQARFDQEFIPEIALVHEIGEAGYSVEGLDGTSPIQSAPLARLEAMASLCQIGIGVNPASANYVRPPDAALPKEPALVILDE